MLSSPMQCLWHIVAAVLQLGELEYEAKSDGNARIKNPGLLDTISNVSSYRKGNSVMGLISYCLNKYSCF